MRERERKLRRSLVECSVEISLGCGSKLLGTERLLPENFAASRPGPCLQGIHSNSPTRRAEPLWKGRR